MPSLKIGLKDKLFIHHGKKQILLQLADIMIIKYTIYQSDTDQKRYDLVRNGLR